MLWHQDDPMKILFNGVVVPVLYALVAANASATATNADWIFPATTTPAPSQPIAADLSVYSTNDNLGWTEADARLAESFILNPGNTTALEFSYNGNHPAYLNGSTLTLTATIAGLNTGSSLTNIQLSYQTRWNKLLNTLTETWAYSLDGGAFINFETDAVTGNVWRLDGSVISGLMLTNGDTILLRDTFSGAAGINGNLDFDNIQISSQVIPEPPSLALVALSISLAGPWLIVRRASALRDRRRRTRT